MPLDAPARTVRDGTTLTPVAIIAAGGRRVPVVTAADGTLEVSAPDDMRPFVPVGMDYLTSDGETVTVPPVAARKET